MRFFLNKTSFSKMQIPVKKVFSSFVGTLNPVHGENNLKKEENNTK
jgi:hypothetical protein